MLPPLLVPHVSPAAQVHLPLIGLPAFETLSLSHERVARPQVNIDEMAISNEQSRLEKENNDLRAILKQYLDGVSVNEDVINNPTNPLVIVNQRLQHTLKARNRQKGDARKQPGDPGAC